MPAGRAAELATKLAAYGLRQEAPTPSYRRIVELLVDAGHPRFSAGSVASWIKDPAIAEAWERQASGRTSRPAGRPTKLLDDEVRHRLGEAFSAGASPQMAARYAGIHPRTLDTWLERAERGEEPWQSEVSQWWGLLAGKYVTACAKVRDGESGYNATLAWLRAVDPDRWAERREVGVTMKDAAEQLTDEELELLTAE